MKTEIVCVKNAGLWALHTEGGYFAAKVWHLEYEPGAAYAYTDEIVKEELLIPVLGKWE